MALPKSGVRELHVFFLCAEKGRNLSMPRNAFQRVIFALLSVIFTVHGYVFYSLYVVNGATLIAVTGESGVLAAIASQGGVYMCGRFLPIWAVVLTEFCLAFLLETTMCILKSC